MRTVRTKYILFNLTLWLLVSCTLDHKQSQESKSNTTSDISHNEEVEFVKKFYEAYIIDFERIPTDENATETLLNKYCTAKMIDKVYDEDLDYDLFLNAQDVDENLRNSITYTSKSANIVQVRYVSIYDSSVTKVNVYLLKDKNNFKVDSVSYEE